MANVEIYTTVWCPFCHRAKRLLKKLGVEFTEIDVGMSQAKREEMMQRSEGGHTVPQIFVDGILVGGSDELAALDADGKLVPMLGLG